MFAFLVLQLFLTHLPRIRLSNRTYRVDKSHKQQRQNRKRSGVNICPVFSGKYCAPSPSLAAVTTAHIRSHDIQNLRETFRVAVNSSLQHFSYVLRTSKCTLLNTDDVPFMASQHTAAVMGSSSGCTIYMR
jgi:hypothetical protein